MPAVARAHGPDEQPEVDLRGRAARAGQRCSARAHSSSSRASSTEVRRAQARSARDVARGDRDRSRQAHSSASAARLVSCPPRTCRPTLRHAGQRQRARRAPCAGARTRRRRARATPASGAAATAAQLRPAPSRRSGTGRKTVRGIARSTRTSHASWASTELDAVVAPSRARRPGARRPRAGPSPPTARRGQLLDRAQQRRPRRSRRGGSRRPSSAPGSQRRRGRAASRRPSAASRSACATVASSSASRRRVSISITCTWATRAARYSESTPRPPADLQHDVVLGAAPPRARSRRGCSSRSGSSAPARDPGARRTAPQPSQAGWAGVRHHRLTHQPNTRAALRSTSASSSCTLDAPQLGEERGRVRDERRLVALLAHRLRA